MKKTPVIFISGWAHGADVMHPLAAAMEDTHEITSLSLAKLREEPRRLSENGQEPYHRHPGVFLAGVQELAAPKDSDFSSEGRFEDILDQPPSQEGSCEGEISGYARSIGRHLRNSGEPAYIVGWSTGGIAAIEATSNYIEKVAGLVLLSATARFCSAKSSHQAQGAGLQQEYTAGVEQSILRAMIRGLKRNPEAVVSDFLSQALFPMAIPADELILRAGNVLKEGTDSLIEGLEYLGRVDLRETIQAITVPCLIIHGRQDRIIPWQAAQFLAENLPDSNVEFLASAGHSLIEQCANELINRVLQFVGSPR